MLTSARNHFSGTVAQTTAGAVNDEIIIRTAAGQEIVATVTRESADRLGLKPGVAVAALVKASSVIVMVDVDAGKVSARNVISGKVSALTKGAVNTDVTITGGNGLEVAAIITNTSAERLGLAPGKPAAAMFKASSVIVGLDG
ncbi:Molybdenum-pterin-binding protein MopA [Pigmentiphaga humi]|uniref:Molybdenum-pterin-binding protein MopA n=1 Tax=Pigmentiphaga humi TaxID=2478468 RepID=A0A3P4B5B7_9BURK|nr:TOBE domain-containing protein [Pigmentiphaga humi]VCU71477.1 Molybdenum-pterin-binding protein MopA [Pigmentiphaga humi]